MATITPPEISPSIRRLVESLVPGGEPVYMDVNPEPDATISECFPSIQAKVLRDGGQLLCGWQLWEWPGVLVEAEFHGIWAAPDGRHVDITPKQDGETRVLFVADPDLSYTGSHRNNVRLPLSKDRTIEDFVALADKRGRIMETAIPLGNGQFKISQQRMQMIQEIEKALGFVGRVIHAGLGADDQCLCKRSDSYRNCCGGAVTSVIRAHESLL